MEYFKNLYVIGGTRTRLGYFVAGLAVMIITGVGGVLALLVTDGVNEGFGLMLLAFVAASYLWSAVNIFAQRLRHMGWEVTSNLIAYFSFAAVSLMAQYGGHPEIGAALGVGLFIFGAIIIFTPDKVAATV